MYCTKCGSPLNEDAKYCESCGAVVEAGSLANRQAHLYQDNGNNVVYKDDMGVGSWLLTLFLTAIPVVNIICLIVWAVSSSPEKRSRKNWAIAQFIWMLIGLILTAVACYGLYDQLSQLQYYF